MVTQTDGKGQITGYDYDPLGRTVAVRTGTASPCRPSEIKAGRCLTYGFDADANPTSQTDQTGTTSSGYDLLGRQTRKTLPGQAAQTLECDAAGNLTATTEAGGTTRYGYDNANQLQALAEPGGSCGAANNILVRCDTFDYDENGRQRAIRYPTNSITPAAGPPAAQRPPPRCFAGVWRPRRWPPTGPSSARSLGGCVARVGPGPPSRRCW